LHKYRGKCTTEILLSKIIYGKRVFCLQKLKQEIQSTLGGATWDSIGYTIIKKPRFSSFIKNATALDMKSKNLKSAF
jgi:hypothetical protein